MVTKKHTISIAFFFAGLMPLASIHAQESYTGPYTGARQFAVGDKVEATYAGSWLPAEVVGVNRKDGKYTIHFDGEKYCSNHRLDSELAKEYVRPRKEVAATATATATTNNTQPTTTKPATNGTKPTTTKPAPVSNKPMAKGFPRFKVGDKVLVRQSGALWGYGIVKEIGNANDLTANKYKLASISAYTGNELDGYSWEWHERVAPLEREDSWTKFYIGEWDVRVPGATTVKTDGYNTYRTFSGGMKLPPLKINADGTYVWKLLNGKTINGKWKPREGVPGIVLLKGEYNADWTLYNANDASSITTFKTDIIYLTAESHTYQSAYRITK